MKLDDSVILLFGLFLIAFASSTYCYEPPELLASGKPIAYIDPWNKNQFPAFCLPMANLPEDPPTTDYNLVTTSGFYAIGTSLPSPSPSPEFTG